MVVRRLARPDVGRCIDIAVDASLGEPTDAIGWVPAVAPVLFRPNARTVFDSLDNWLIHPVLRRNAADATAAYAAILPRADRVFVSGPASAKVFTRWRPDAVVLPNGVDPDHWSGTWPRPGDLPAGPLVGYAGKLAERIDDERVAAVAALVPDARFAFIGPILDKRAVRRMQRMPNVLLLGDRPYADLPAYLHAFDVAWIPHRVGDAVLSGAPIGQ
jgi:hypothetical protein